MKKNIPLSKIINTNIEIDIVDIGANPIDGNPPYQSLINNNIASLIGFEPNAEALNELKLKKSNRELYLPYAVGDGKTHNFNICMASGMSSILEPNFDILDNFHGFSEWAKIKEKIPIDTKRLDDISEIKNLDYLKIDIQGGELMVFENAINKLKDCLVIHTEVEFLQMYKNQPLFSEVEMFLRKQGFIFHKFDPLVSRIVKPLMKQNNIYAGLSQTFWADAIFVKDFFKLDLLNSKKLLKFALILHDIYESFDIVLKILLEHDRLFQTKYQNNYINFLSNN